MKLPRHIGGTGLLGLGILLCFAVVSAHADTTPPLTLPNPPPALMGDKEAKKEPRLLSNLILDYEGATTNSSEVLNAKVTVVFKNASFLSALDAVMDAASKTCHIECRQLSPLRLSMKVTDMPVASLLDSLAKLSGARLFVLPSKLIIAPETALTDDEKKKAKLYGVLLTGATLPDTPDAKALTTTNARNKNILDIANFKISWGIKNIDLHHLLMGWGGPSNLDGNTFRMRLVGPIEVADVEDRSLSFTLKDVKFGDALASYAHLLGMELYLLPDQFLICFPDKITGSPAPSWAQNAVPAFQPPSTNFTDTSENGS